MKYYPSITQFIPFLPQTKEVSSASDLIEPLKAFLEENEYPYESVQSNGIGDFLVVTFSSDIRPFVIPLVGRIVIGRATAPDGSRNLMCIDSQIVRALFYEDTPAEPAEGAQA